MKEQIDGHVKALRKASTQGGLSGIECNALADSLAKIAERLSWPSMTTAPVIAGHPTIVDITTLTVDEAEEVIDAAGTEEELDVFESAEKAGAERVGVLRRIERRRDEINEG